MVLSEMFSICFFSLPLVFGHLQTTTWLRTSELGEKRMILTKDQDRQQRSIGSLDHALECQRGNPLGSSYSGTVNQTKNGRTCQVWSTSQPHQPMFTDVGRVDETEAGDHNYCRNPSRNLNGVWCYTTDPDKRWEHCFVPI